MTCSTIVIVSIVIRYYPWMRWPISVVVQAVTTFVLLFVGLSDVGRWARWAVWIFCLFYSISTFITAWPMISINVAGRTKKAFFGGSSLIAYCAGNIVGSQVRRYTKGTCADHRRSSCPPTRPSTTGAWSDAPSACAPAS